MKKVKKELKVPTILLVEDGSNYRKDLEKRLEKEGWNVVCFGNVRKTIKAINDGLKYDAALVDLVLPDIGTSDPYVRGQELVDESRRVNPDTIVICMLAYAHEVDGAHCFQKGSGTHVLIDALKHYFENKSIMGR